MDNEVGQHFYSFCADIHLLLITYKLLLIYYYNVTLRLRPKTVIWLEARRFDAKAWPQTGRRPMAWNALPDDLRDPSLSADNFRKTLKTHLFRNALRHLAH